MMDWLDLCLPLTKESEGCKLEAYPDPVSGGDPWTIGWGSTGYGIGRGVVWTQAEADSELTSRLMVIGRQIDSFVPAATTPQQKAALADFAYNLGVAALEHSTLVRYLKAGSIDAAAGEFGCWDHSCGKVIEALTIRRERERQLFLTGVW